MESPSFQKRIAHARRHGQSNYRLMDIILSIYKSIVKKQVSNDVANLRVKFLKLMLGRLYQRTEYLTLYALFSFKINCIANRAFNCQRFLTTVHGLIYKGSMYSFVLVLRHQTQMFHYNCHTM